MSENRDNKTLGIEEEKILDFLYGGKADLSDLSSEEVNEACGFEKALDFWRETHQEEDPSPSVRARVLEAAARSKKQKKLSSFLKEVLFFPVRKPAFSLALVLVVVFSVVLVYHQGGKERGSRRQRDQNRFSSKESKTPLGRTVAALDKKSVEKDKREAKYETVSTKREEIVLAEAPQQGRETAAQERLVVKDGNLRKANELALRQSAPRKALFNETKRFRNRRLKKKPAVSSMSRNNKKSGEKRRAAFDGKDLETVSGKGGASVLGGSVGGLQKQQRVGRSGGKRGVSAYYSNAIQLQKQSQHLRASQLFAKSYKAAKTQQEKNKILLRWAKSELAQGNKKKVVYLLSLVKNRKGWVGKEVAKLKRTLSPRRSQSKTKKKTDKKKSRKVYPTSAPPGRK